MTALIISNEQMQCIMKIDKYLEEFDLFIESVSKSIESEERKADFLAC